MPMGMPSFWKAIYLNKTFFKNVSILDIAILYLEIDPKEIKTYK